MNINELATAFVALLKQGKMDEAGAEFWSDDIVSIEPMGEQTRWEGRKAVQGKSDWWVSMHEVHSFGTEGPYVNGDHFICIFSMDVTNKESGQRITGNEAGLYTVKDGKIVEERFFMMPMG